MAGDYLTSWQDIQSKWDQAQKDGIFAESKKPFNPEPTKIQDYLVEGFDAEEYGMSPEMAELAANSEKMTDADYWAAVSQLARADVARPRAPRQEAPSHPSPSDLLQEAGSIDTPNPVNASAKGQDSGLVITPDWAGGAELIRLEKMKLELHALGDKLATMGANTSWAEKATDSAKKQNEDALKKIASLWRQIDELSNSLSPGTVQKDSLS